MTTIIEDTHLPISIDLQETSFEAFRKVVTYDYRENASQLSARREIVTGRHAVAIVAYDPKIERLVMIRQFRLGAQLGTGKGMTIEIPAGLIDEGETAENTARRELLEETGLTTTKVQPLCQFLTTPGMTDEVLHLFYAEVDATNLVERAGADGESEQTFPFTSTLEEAMDAVDSNALYNGIVMLGLLWFMRHKNSLTNTPRPLE